MKMLKATSIIALFLWANVNLSAQKGTNVVKVGGGILGLTSSSTNSNGTKSTSTDTYGGFGVAIEHGFAENFSVVLGFDLNSKSQSASSGAVSVTGTVTVLTVAPEVRWYPTAATNGFYIGAQPAYHSIGAKVSGGGVNLDATEGYFGVGAVAGFQFHLSSLLTLQLGGAYGTIFPKDGGESLGRFNADLSVGFKF